MALASPPEAGSKTNHLAALDGLRGIAILLVVWYHIWEMTWLPADVHLGPWIVNFNVFPETGSAGVDLFFFISGFCLFYPYARTLFDGAPKQSVALFTYRRVLKIVPSYYLAIAALVAIGFAQFNSTGDAIKEIVTHLTFTQTFFADTAGGIDGVMWSLTTEASFYVLFPLICWFAMKRMVSTFAVLVAFAIVYRFLVYHSYNVGLFMDRLPGTIDLFASGMFAAWLFRYVAVRKPKLAANKALWLGVASLALCATYLVLQYAFVTRYTADWNFRWKVIERPEFDLLLIPLTLGSLFTFSLWQRILANRFFTFMSFVSYNLYLWHQPIARMILDHKLLFHGANPILDHNRGLVFELVAFGAGLLVSWIITVAIEQPLLRRKPFVALLTRTRLRQAPAGNVP